MKTFGNAAVMSSALLLMTLIVSGGAEARCTPGVGSDGDYNTCIGTQALHENTTGVRNTASGYQALHSNTTGNYNTASGYRALGYNTTGRHNTASGGGALYSNTTGESNTASGVTALHRNTTGGKNVAVGFEAARNQTTGSDNTAVGHQAGFAWTTGKNNIAIGAGAGKNQTAGSNNIAIGAVGAASDTAIIRIGTSGSQTSTFIAGIRNSTVGSGMMVVVTADGQLGVSAPSSRRFKRDIHSMGDASSAIMRLAPVTFHYKEAADGGDSPLQYGLIAEEVAEVMPELVIYGSDGKPEGVAYQVLPSLLLNEYQKQAKELAATKAELAENKAQFKATETKLEAVESELATIKLMLSKLASVQGGQTQLAAAP